MNFNTLTLPESHGGHRARTQFTQWGKLTSLIQKATRRCDKNVMFWATSQIYAILLQRGKSNWTNLINRVLVISCEDIYNDPFIFNHIYNLVNDLDNMRESKDLERIAVTLFSIMNTLVSAKARGRNASYIRHVSLSMIAGKDISHIPELEKYKKQIPNMSRRPSWMTVLDMKDVFFTGDLKIKSGNFSAKGRDYIIKNVFKELIKDEKNVEKLTAINNMLTIFTKKASKHREAFIFPVTAILMKEVKVTQYEVKNFHMKISDVYASLLKNLMLNLNIPSYALDCHTGRFKKGSIEGDKHFINIGSVCMNEKLIVPKSFKQDYMNYKLRIKPCKQVNDIIVGKNKIILNDIIVGKNKIILNDIEGSSIIFKVRAQLPCGVNRPDTWIIKTENGKNWWLKTVYKKPNVQLDFDAQKSKYGVVPLGMKWDDREFIYCPSVYGDIKINTILNRGVRVVDVKDTRLSKQDIFTDDMLSKIIPALALRGVFDITDTNLTNMMYINNKAISYDEMGYRNKGIAKSLTSFLFVKDPRKNVLKQFTKYIENHREELLVKFYLWKMDNEKEKLRKMALLKLVAGNNDTDITLLNLYTGKYTPKQIMSCIKTIK